MVEQSPTDKVAALGFSYQVALDRESRRTVVLQSHLPLDTSIEDINAVLDKCAAAADHQIDGYRLTEFTLVVQELERQLLRAKKDLAHIDVGHLAEWKSRHKGSEEGFKLTVQQEAQRNSAKRNIETGEADLANKKDDMHELRQRISRAAKQKE